MGVGNDDHGTGEAGLQTERTRLAWSRTALSFAAAGALLLHAGLARHGVYGSIPGTLVLTLAVVVYGLGRLRYRHLLAGSPRGTMRYMAWQPRLVGASGAVSALLALIVFLRG